MEDRHRDILDKLLKHQDKIADLNTEDLTDYLVMKQILVKDNVRRLIEKQKTKSKVEANTWFLDFMKSRGPQAFEMLYEAMVHSGQIAIAQLLEDHLPVGYSLPSELKDIYENNQMGKSSSLVGSQRIMNPGLSRINSIPRSRSASPANIDMLTRVRQPLPQEIEAAQRFYEKECPITASIPEDSIPPTRGVMTDMKVKSDTAPDSWFGLATAGDAKAFHMPVKKFDSEMTYRNFTKPKGLAIVFNNRNFNNIMPTRVGTDVDATNFIKLLQKLGYEVKRKDDHTAKQMAQAIGRFILKNEHEKYDSCVIVFLTHGEHNELFGVDGKSVKVSEVVQQVANCYALIGKPKLFFLQACRGGEFDQGMCGSDFADVTMSHLVHKNADGSDKDNNVMAETKRVLQSINTIAVDKLSADDRMTAMRGMDLVDANEMNRRLPQRSDVFIGYATTPGYVSWRNSAKGSWYVQAICEVFAEYAHERDLLSLMTIVNRRVALKFKSTSGDYVQMPEPVSNLIRDFYFFPNRHEP